MVWVNLMPWRQRAIKRAIKQSLWLVLLPSLMMFISLYLWRSRYVMTNQQLQQQLVIWRQSGKQMEERLVHLQMLQMQAEQLQQQTEKAQLQRQRTQRWQAFIAQLDDLIPETLWLTSLQQTAEGLLLSGLSRQLSSIADFQQQLKQQPLFLSVQQAGMSQADGQTLQFSLLGMLLPEQQSNE